jgi:hypothetical protein
MMEQEGLIRSVVQNQRNRRYRLQAEIQWDAEREIGGDYSVRWSEKRNRLIIDGTRSGLDYRDEYELSKRRVSH